MRIAVLSNPCSGRNRKYLGKVRVLLGRRPEVVHREAATPAEVGAVLDELLTGGLDLLAVNAGDGTVQASLSLLLNRATEDDLPLLAVLPGGTANMTARDLNGRHRGLLPSVRSLLRVLDAGDLRRRRVERSLLRVQRRPDEAPLYGFFLGAGALIQGMEYCFDHVHRLGLKERLGPAIAMIRTLYGVLRHDPRFAPSVPVSCHVDGGAGLERDAVLLLVTTLERLLLGLRPFWGREEGVLKCTLIEAQARRLALRLPGLLRGRGGRLRPCDGYHSHNGGALSVGFDGQFSLDGELFEARRHWGAVRVEATPPVGFLRL